MWIDGSKTKQKLKINIPRNFGAVPLAEMKMIMDCPNISAEEICEINRAFEPYIFYHRTSSGKYTCFCTSCNSEFHVDEYDIDLYFENCAGPSHNQGFVCPCCHGKGKAKSAGYSMKSLSGGKYVTVYKQKNGVVYAINLKVYKTYNGDPFCNSWNNRLWDNGAFERMPDLLAEYESLYVWTAGSAFKYNIGGTYTSDGWLDEFRKVKNPISNRFKMESYVEYYHGKDFVTIGCEVIENSFLRYVNCIPHNNFDECAYFSACTVYPIMEFVMKAGLTGFAEALIYRGKKYARTVDWSAKSPKRFFRYLDKQECEKIISGDIQPPIVEVYSRFKKSGMKRDWEFCDTYCKVYGSGGRQYKCSLQRFEEMYKYIQKQMKVCTYDNIYRAFIQYIDYIECAESLNYNMEVQGTRFPRNLQEAHDNAVEARLMLRRREREEREHEKNRRYNEGYQERYKKLCRFYGRFEFEGLTVVVPEKIEDIIAEGAKLEHCVGGYAVRHCTGQTTILFVRKCEEIDKPYFTVEVGENEQGKYIVQCHGFRNEQGRVKGKFVIWEKPDIIKDFEKEFGSFLKSLKNMLRAEPV